MNTILATIVASRRARFLENTELLNLFNRFDGGVGKIMQKAALPSSGMDLSGRAAPPLYGAVVCHIVCAFCVVSSGPCHLSNVDKYGE